MNLTSPRKNYGIWYNLHGNCVNLITLTKQTFSSHLVFMKSLMGCCRCWGNGIDLQPGAGNFHIFRWSGWNCWRTVLSSMLVSQMSKSVILMKSVVTYTHDLGSPHQVARYSFFFGSICTATDSITEAQAEDSRQNENVNVSRVLHWSR